MRGTPGAGRGQSCLRSCTGASDSAMGLALVPSQPGELVREQGAACAAGWQAQGSPARPWESGAGPGGAAGSHRAARAPQSCLWLQQVGRIPPLPGLRAHVAPRCLCGRHLCDWQGRQRLWGSFLRRGWGSTQVGHAAAPASLQTPRHPLPFLHTHAPVGVLLGCAGACEPPFALLARRGEASGLTRGCPTRASHPGGARTPPRPSQHLTLCRLLLLSRPRRRRSSCTYITPSCRSGGKGGAGTPAKAPGTRPGLPAARRAANPPSREGNRSKRFPFAPGGCSQLASRVERGSETPSPARAVGAGCQSQASGLLSWRGSDSARGQEVGDVGIACCF